MRKLALLALFCLLAARAHAGQKISVDEAEQRLAQAEGKPDLKVAHLLEGVELTERCSPARLARWQAAHPGKHTHDALVALADASALLNLPPAELPPDPAPNLDEQRRMVTLAVHYVEEAIRGLPNFLATRQTVYYEDAPAELGMNSTLSVSADTPRPLRVATRTSINIAYRAGHEVLDLPPTSKRRPYVSSHYLTTSGEFGPILNIVVVDAAKGRVSWSHWERGDTGLVAHFHYTVPEQVSHYHVTFPCEPGAVEHFPGYDGDFGVNPATGAILRIAIRAQLPAPCQKVATSIVTEFGEVTLGERTYVCPLHGVSLTEMPIYLGGTTARPAVEIPTRQVNDVIFTGYRLFHATARIVSIGEDVPEGKEQGPTGP
jgi:hypothetical protein